MTNTTKEKDAVQQKDSALYFLSQVCEITSNKKEKIKGIYTCLPERKIPKMVEMTTHECE